MTSLGNNTDGLEVGMVVAWTLSVNPSDSYLECNGQVVDSTKYPKLYALMHNTPDYRGVFLRGLGGNSANLGILQGDAIRNITGKISLSWTGNGAQLFADSTISTGAFQLTDYHNVNPVSDYGGNERHPGSFYFNASRVVPVAVENRPINKSVRYFIKAK